MSNANEARQVVFELFQDLERVTLDDCDTMLHRELAHSQIISEQRGYEARLIGWIEVVGDNSKPAG